VPFYSQLQAKIYNVKIWNYVFGGITCGWSKLIATTITVNRLVIY